jgi:hypothetical protein
LAASHRAELKLSFLLFAEIEKARDVLGQLLGMLNKASIETKVGRPTFVVQCRLQLLKLVELLPHRQSLGPALLRALPSRSTTNVARPLMASRKSCVATPVITSTPNRS